MPSQRPQKYYVVTKGRRPGIYNNWIEAGPHVVGLTSAKHETFPTYAEALEIWEEAQSSGWVQVLGGPPLSQHPSITSSRPLGPSVSLSALEGDRRFLGSFSERTHYVVARGRNPGVYSSWIKASAQVEGLPGVIYQAFNTGDEAWRVYEGARLRGEVQVLDDNRSRQQSSRHQTRDQTMELSTPPLTPPIPERAELPLADRRDHDDFPSRLSQLNISPSNSSANSPSSFYRTASHGTPDQGDGFTYTPPRRLGQHHSLPTTSFDRLPPIPRASSDRGNSYTSPSSPRGKEQDSPRRSSSVSVGPPPGVRGYVECKKLIPRTRDIPLSPINSSDLSLRSVDSPHWKPASSPSLSRKSSTDSRSYQTATAAQSHSHLFSSTSPQQSRASPPFTRISRTPQNLVAAQSPAKQLGNIHTSVPSPSQSFSAPSSTPVLSRKGTGDVDVTFSPVPFDLSKGTSFLNGGKRKSRNNTPSVSSLGLAPMSAPHSVYETEFDPRSPMSKKAVVPLSMNSASFGRPSPAPPQNILPVFSSLFKP